MKSGEPFAMAGIYARGKHEGDPVTFAILTTDANEVMEPVHDRMPVILPLGHEKQWLPPGGTPYFNQFLAELMMACPVTPKMNRAGFNVPEAIVQLDEPSYRSPWSISCYVGNPMQGSVFKPRVRPGRPRAPGSLQSTLSPAQGNPAAAPMAVGVRASAWKRKECDMAEQLLSFASELRTRAKEILALAVSTDDLEIRAMRRAIAEGYEKLARRIERRAREVEMA
jgi:SOS response associated peptidase (SRAP)